MALGNSVHFHNWCAPNGFQGSLHIDPFSPKSTISRFEQFPSLYSKVHKILPYCFISVKTDKAGFPGGSVGKSLPIDAKDRQGKPSNPYFYYGNIYYEFLIWVKYCAECIMWIYLKYNPIK